MLRALQELRCGPSAHLCTQLPHYPEHPFDLTYRHT
jgi:hypothetical protein